MGVSDYFKKLFSVERHRQQTIDSDEVQNLIGYHFRDTSMLELALTHRSYVRCVDNTSQSNERLEFLGDSVLGLVIANQLFRDHKGKAEGDLTKLKAMLVNEITLATIGKQIKLNEHVRLSADESKAGGRERASIISDTFESVIGAVFLDGGFDAARDVVLRLIYVRKDEIVTDKDQQNYKGDLLELVQSRGQGMPRYEVISEEGPDHQKTFSVIVNVGGRRLGEGDGSSKKEAEQKAAAQALRQIKRSSNK